MLQNSNFQSHNLTLMKTLCLLLAFFVLYETEPSFTDLGIPSIHAVCKVTLKNGEIIEGFVVFARGGYANKYQYNGFCYTNNENKYRRLKLYDFHFKLSYLNNSYPNRPTSTLHYVENISVNHDQSSVTEFNDDTQVLTKTHTDVQKYKLLDQMTLYTSIPLSLGLGYNEEGDDDGNLRIDVTTLKSVELIEEPSTQILKIIEEATKRQQKSEAEEPWTDFNPPVWYHDIIKNQEKYKYLSEYW